MLTVPAYCINKLQIRIMVASCSTQGTMTRPTLLCESTSATSCYWISSCSSISSSSSKSCLGRSSPYSSTTSSFTCKSSTHTGRTTPRRIPPRLNLVWNFYSVIPVRFTHASIILPVTIQTPLAPTVGRLHPPPDFVKDHACFLALLDLPPVVAAEDDPRKAEAADESSAGCYHRKDGQHSVCHCWEGGIEYGC